MAVTPDDYRDKILYNYFDRIKKTINREVGEKFYDMDANKHIEEIDKVIDEIRNELAELKPKQERVNFDGLN